VVSGCWFFLLLATWVWFLRIARKWESPSLGVDQFLYFQICAGVFVLAIAALAHGYEARGVLVKGTMWLFDAVLLVGSVTYVTLAWAIRVRLPRKAYLGLAFSLLVVMMATLGFRS
jgi:hypothetical protein